MADLMATVWVEEVNDNRMLVTVAIEGQPTESVTIDKNIWDVVEPSIRTKDYLKDLLKQWIPSGPDTSVQAAEGRIETRELDVTE